MSDVCDISSTNASVVFVGEHTGNLYAGHFCHDDDNNDVTYSGEIYCSFF